MSIDEIRVYRNAKPFEPFDLVMSDGRVVRVEERMRIAFSPSGKSVSVYQGGAAETVAVAGIAELKARPLPPHMRRLRHDL
jgi:hypothetical protein